MTLRRHFITLECQIDWKISLFALVNLLGLWRDFHLSDQPPRLHDMVRNSILHRITKTATSYNNTTTSCACLSMQGSDPCERAFGAYTGAVVHQHVQVLPHLNFKRTIENAGAVLNTNMLGSEMHLFTHRKSAGTALRPGLLCASAHAAVKIWLLTYLCFTFVLPYRVQGGPLARSR